MATTVVLPSDEALAARAASVVLATVRERAPAADGLPALAYRLRALERVAGSAIGTEPVLRLPGGVAAGGRGLALAGIPVLEIGQRLLLFVQPRGDGSYQPVDLMLGLFRVEAVAGRTIAYRDLTGVRLLPRASGEGAADAPRDLAGFRRWLQARELGLPRTQDYFLAAPEAMPMAPAAKHALAISSTLPSPLGCGPEGGNIVRWMSFDGAQAVAWRRHESGMPGLEDGGVAAFDQALLAWSAPAASAVRLADAGAVAATTGLGAPDGLSTLLFGDPNDTLPGSFTGSGLLALGGAWLDCDRTAWWGGQAVHPVVEGDIVIQDGAERFLEASADPQAAAAELFAHELGHTLGFAHSDDPQALMFGLVHDDGRGAALSADELGGLALLYPAAAGSPGLGAPPAAPTGVTVTLEGSDATVRWQREDADLGVRIERMLDDGAFTLRASVGGVSQFADRGLLRDTTYRYRLQTFRADGASDYSETVTVTTGGMRAPAAPSNLRTAPLADHSVRLSWQDNAADELFYRVESEIDGAWQSLAQTLPADTTAAVIHGFEDQAGQRLRVRAAGILEESAPSNPVLARPLPADSACTPSDQRLCLLSGRYAITVHFADPRFGGALRDGQAVPETDKTGRMWFFDVANTELIVKMIDGSSANGFAWLFYGGLSDLAYWIDVEDTETGVRRTYHNPKGALCGLADTHAFERQPAPSQPPTTPGTVHAMPPVAAEPLSAEPLSAEPLSAEPLSAEPLSAEPLSAPAARSSTLGGACVADPETLCLLEGRFAVQVAFVNQHAGDIPGTGQAIADGDKTGFFYFFNRLNTDLVVKMLDGRGNNDHFWLFYGGLSDVAYTITVTDTTTGAQRIFNNPAGEVCGGKDTRTFFDPLGIEPPFDEPPIP